MARKKILKYEGTLIKRDISKWAKDDEKIQKFWDKIKDTLFFLIDEKEAIILNTKLEDIYRKFKGRRVEIVIQEAKSKPKIKIPDLDEEYDTTETILQKLKLFLQDDE
ncbi:MAG: hypothetical protein KAX33_07015 [Candidatus Lokiarchaeota archaeon]|nr:hypothetical protein [Candidatus Lokiarchaeota archaeon]